MRAGDHPIMSQSDLSPFLPGGTSDPYASFFDNTSSQGLYGQFDMIDLSSNSIFLIVSHLLSHLIQTLLFFC